MIRFEWSWRFAAEVLPDLLQAGVVTVGATLASFLIAIVGGLVLALLRGAPLRLVRWPAAGFIEFVRTTPPLVQIYFLFFVLPEVGIVLPALATGVVALGVHYATYTSEVYRAGIENVPKGQWDAAQALGLRPLRAFFKVILPQALPPILPALGNYLITLFKETPLLSAIAIVEMLQRAKIIGSLTFRYVEPITLVGLVFLVLSLISAYGIRRLERRLARSQV